MIALRPYRPQDLDRLHAIDIVCFEDSFRFSRAALQRFLGSRHALTTVAEDVSGIVGFILVHADRRKRTPAYVVTLDVLASHRRTGLGSRLLGEGERLARSAGASSMRLHVHTGNATARSFYARHGYAMFGSAPGYYGESLDALRLKKSLTEGSDF